MKLTSRGLRTKHMLILGTSCLFFCGTIWIGSHPEERPIIQQIPVEYQRVEVAVATKQFDNTKEWLEILGFEFNDTATAQRPVTLSNNASSPTTDTSGYVIPPTPAMKWQLRLPKHVNTSSPAIVTALFGDDSDRIDRVLLLIESLRMYVRGENHLLVFQMEKVRKDISKIEVYCNVTLLCTLLDFPVGLFPAHVKIQEYGAYKPILLQKALTVFPAVIWLDGDIPIGPNGTWATLKNTMSNRITVWNVDNKCGASAYTFKNMLPYFSLREDSLFFATMIERGRYAVSRGQDKLMMLWLNCSLTRNCIVPYGAESGHCEPNCNDWKPRFQYMGCHKYEASALIASLWTFMPRQSYGSDCTLIESSKALNLTSINQQILTYQDKSIKYRIDRVAEVPDDERTN